MKTAALVRMANEIAANFRSYSEAEAVAAIASHLRRFWEPRMREELRRAIQAGRAADLSPLVVAAMQRL